MPINATPEYAVAEREYTKASTNVEKLQCLEKMLSLAPSHKGGETLRAEIKTKISKLKEKLLKERESKKKGYSLAVKKEGAAQVVLVGPPNTGKTALVNKLSKSNYEVGGYAFTTSKPNLGTLDYKTVKIQLVDLPPLIEGAAIKQAPYFAIIRNANLALLIIDDPKQLPPLLKDFEDSHILLNKPRPSIRIKRNATGGLEFIGEKFVQGKIEIVKKILREHNVASAVVEIFDTVKPEDFFEVIDEKLAYLPALIVLNKQTKNELGKWEKFEIISLVGDEFDLLKDKIWENLKLIKIYTKEPGKKPKMTHPITLEEGSTIKDMAQHVHKDFIKKFDYAKIWGKSAKHASMKVGPEHKLADDDVVEIHLK